MISFRLFPVCDYLFARLSTAITIKAAQKVLNKNYVMYVYIYTHNPKYLREKIIMESFAIEKDSSLQDDEIMIQKDISLQNHEIMRYTKIS